MRRSRMPLWLAPLILVAPLLPTLAYAAPDAPRPGGAAQGELPERGVFVEHCRFDHRLPDDPIVHPGMAGMSHSHDFFGNKTTSAASTLQSLLGGGTSCRTLDDTAAYWVPTLSRNGQAVTPTAMTIYYRAPFGPLAAQVQPFPAGFKMIAGDASATTPSTSGGRIAFWNCRGLNRMGPLPPECPPEAPLQLHLNFPECWDGVNLDSADHKSHLVYRAGRLGCPADHPVLLPRLTMIVNYPVSGPPGTITLASGSVYSGHGDFFNSWNQAALEQRVRECLQAGVRCQRPLQR